ncbi:MAG: zinc ribbon domain-containing protein [Chloroflexi bacterium]|nr:zinc ribbon domain-containing protein [Chloroflexota bacterium]
MHDIGALEIVIIVGVLLVLGLFAGKFLGIRRAGRRSRTTLCPQCGQPNDGSAAFCLKCGTPLRQTLRPETTEKPARTGRRLRIFGVVSFIIVVLVIVAAIWFFGIGRGGNDGGGGGSLTQQNAAVTKDASELALKASDIENGCTQLRVNNVMEGTNVLSVYSVTFFCGGYGTLMYGVTNSSVTVYSSVDAARNAYASKAPDEYGSASAVQHYHTDIGDECVVVVIQELASAECLFRDKNVLVDVGTTYPEDAEFYARIVEQRIG